MIAVLLALAAVVPDTTLVRSITVAPAETLQVTITGSGRPVVLLTGLIGSAYNYRKILPGLHARGFRTIVIEPLGVGHSSRPDKVDYSFTAQADRIAAVLDTLGLSHVLVVAHAGSGSMALRMAVRHPETVSGLGLIMAGPDESTATPAIRKAVKFRFFIKLFTGRGRIKSEIRKGFIESSGDTSWITPEVIDSYTAGPGGNIGAVMRVLQGWTKAVEPDSISNNLWRIHVPVRLLLGTADVEGAPSRRKQTFMEQRLPNFRVDSVPGSGLHIHEEQPQAVVDAITRWMQG